uniref:Uncharacterized protein n=1 Tax=Plectus sambesii TaxID=2011161 RepID=A0A914VJN7_9BILA
MARNGSGEECQLGLVGKEPDQAQPDRLGTTRCARQKMRRVGPVEHRAQTRSPRHNVNGGWQCAPDDGGTGRTPRARRGGSSASAVDTDRRPAAGRVGVVARRLRRVCAVSAPAPPPVRANRRRPAVDWLDARQ